MNILTNATAEINTNSNLSLKDLSEKGLLNSIYNNIIKDGIDHYATSLKKIEREVFKYLGYYYKKFQGNIEIPITNIMARFGVSRSWVMKLLKRLARRGLVVKTGGGYGQKVTKRTFSEIGGVIYKAITCGFKIESLSKKPEEPKVHTTGDTTLGSIPILISSKEINSSKDLNYEGEIPPLADFKTSKNPMDLVRTALKPPDPGRYHG